MHEVMTLLSRVDDPLRTAAAIAAAEPDRAVGEEILGAAITHFGAAVQARSLQALERYARSVPEEAAAATAERFLALSTKGARWVAGLLFERAGNHQRAAEELGAIEDAEWGEARALRLIALARIFLNDGRNADLWPVLREAARAAQRHQTLLQVGRLLKDAAQRWEPPVRARRRIAVVGTGTLSFWTGALEPALFAFGVGAEMFSGEYGRYQQEIRDPESALAAFRPDLVVIAVDHRGLGLPAVAENPDREVAAAVEQFASLWALCRDRFNATVVQCNFEVPAVDSYGRLSNAIAGGRARLLQRINLGLWEAAERANVAVFDVNAAAAAVGGDRWHDESRWIAAKQYPAAEALPRLAKQLAAVVRAACGLTSKCVVVDLDNTLWGGVIGEDGLTGIRLGGDPEGEAFVAFQRYLQGLRDRGIALAVCSKNNDADARAVFQQHPEIVLRESDFADFRANWDPKPDNLRLIAKTLNIGLDSLVFVDDNPVERNFIRRELPDVEVPELPEDPAQYARALHDSGLLEAFSFTTEDRQRAESYRTNADRANALAGASDVESYLHQLQMRLELRAFDELNLPRIVQLMNKTNQFNLTTRRTTDGEARRWMEDASCYTQSVRVTDRFGDSGLTGVLIAVRDGAHLRIHTWLLSCRVLGRRIEDAMLASLIDRARQAGIPRLRGEYIPTAKNDQVRTLFDRFGFTRLEEMDAGTTYELVVADAPDLSTAWFEIDDSTRTPHYRRDFVAS